jgi:hypothetical protein
MKFATVLVMAVAALAPLAGCTTTDRMGDERLVVPMDKSEDAKVGGARWLDASGYPNPKSAAAEQACIEAYGAYSNDPVPKGTLRDYVDRCMARAGFRRN